MAESDEVVLEFIAESRENLGQVEFDLVRLEEAPDDAEAVARIFRAVHTIKGTCGFFGYKRLEAVTHAGENLLSALRDGRVPFETRLASALLALVDVVRGMLDGIEGAGAEPEGDHGALIAELRAIEQGEAAPSAGAPPRPATRPGARETPEVAALRGAPVLEIPPFDAPLGQSLRARRTDTRELDGRSVAPEATVRVRVEVLDELLNLVGELVLARNQLVQVKEAAHPALVGPIRRLDAVTSELQERAMQTRMQPVKTVWSGLPRVVRDLSLQCGKEVRLELEGEETGLDRSLVEAIKDPITHIVRNAVDHGIEPPDERARAGKPRSGHLKIAARHEGGYVILAIADDGRGIDPGKLRVKAVEKGLLTAEEAARLDDERARQLVFHPGFSTAEKVTSISGRGVGMDVVKTNIERIGGSIELQSEVGKGTLVHVRVPLTLAIVPALLVETAAERFAVPQVNLVELVQMDPETAARVVERVGDAPVLRHRGRLLPLIWLREALGLDPRPVLDAMVSVVVLQAYDMHFGLVVDAIHDTEEIVVKALSSQLGEVEAFAGATILGDGSVALILDPVGLSRLAGVDRRELQDVLVAGGGGGAAGGRATDDAYLLCRVGTRRFALPVAAVARLETIPVERVEAAGLARLVQYRGTVLPLFAADETPLAVSEDGALQVVVCHAAARTVGLVVDAIVDVGTWDRDVLEVGRGVGVSGTIVLDGRVAEVVDLDALALPPRFALGRDREAA